MTKLRYTCLHPQEKFALRLWGKNTIKCGKWDSLWFSLGFHDRSSTVAKGYPPALCVCSLHYGYYGVVGGNGNIWSLLWDPTSHCPSASVLCQAGDRLRITTIHWWVHICVCLWVRVHVFVDASWKLGIIPRESSGLVFETEALIGLGRTKKARLTSQQTVGTHLSPPTQCWNHRCMPALPILFT